jgi:hypothetical protein
MSTGYYQEHMTPPEYEGQRWEQRAPHSEAGTILSPFPPATLGNPAEDVAAFRDFQNWQSRDRKTKHPEYYCTDCGIRYAGVVCAGKVGCGSARVSYPDEMRALYRCLSCDRRFAADRLCGPCIGDRRTAAAPTERIA